LVMGLGLHGGGLESARFMLKHGAEVTVTDLRDDNTLKPVMDELDAFCGSLGRKPVHYILGNHEIEDFEKADIVIKNPAVRPDSVFLKAAKRVETDISIYLTNAGARLFAVTGSKGKSVTSSALAWILGRNRKRGKCFLGGNITVSPLSFTDELCEDDDVVLELSSFQLGDLKSKKNTAGRYLLTPNAAILTAIMEDHLDRYASMKEYIDDKKVIYKGQDESCVTVAGDDEWGKSFLHETNGCPLVRSLHPLGAMQSGGWIEGGVGFARLVDFDEIDSGTKELVPQKLLIPGEHQKQNLLSAALAAYSMGIDAAVIREALSSFAGIEHRLELFHETKKARFYNDSAATIPQAAAACIEALCATGELVLVTGGTDKNLDFSPLAKAAKKAKSVILLAGTGSVKLMRLLGEEDVAFEGPYDNIDTAARRAVEIAANVKRSVCNAALSPGCASFGMFQNEFDRGRKWKEAVLRNC